MSPERPGLARHWTILVLAVVLTLGSAVTWLLAEISCNLLEYDERPGLCGDDGMPGTVNLALVAAAVVPITYLIARRTGRLSIFAVGAVGAVLACGSVWSWFS
jgi:hypothetical protein